MIKLFYFILDVCLFVCLFTLPQIKVIAMSELVWYKKSIYYASVLLSSLFGIFVHRVITSQLVLVVV